MTLKELIAKGQKMIEDDPSMADMEVKFEETDGFYSAIIEIRYVKAHPQGFRRNFIMLG